MPKKSQIAIEELDMSAETFNILKRSGCNTLNDIAKFASGDIKPAQAVFPKTKTEINSLLRQYHIRRKHSIPA